MLIHLIKKDVLIAKKYAVLVMIIGIIIPLFVFWRVQRYSESLGFILAVVFSEFMFCQNLSMKENQYSNAAALLCATPYKRSEMVLSKYVLFILIFMYCTVVYVIEIYLIPQMGKLDVKYILTVFLVASFIYSIYMPIQYQMGYEKTKLFFMAIILGASFGLPVLIANKNLNVLSLLVQSSFVIVSIIWGISILAMIVSVIVSVKIYRKKDLA